MDTIQIVTIVSLILITGIVVGSGIWLILVFKQLRATLILLPVLLPSQSLLFLSFSWDLKMVLVFLINYLTRKINPMTRQSNQSDQNCCQHSSGFVFGLICGAVISAVIAVIIYKNNRTEIFEKLEQKIKHFFDHLYPQKPTSRPKTKPRKSSPSKFIAATVPKTATKKDITPVFVKKSPPKMFVKPKK